MATRDGVEIEHPNRARTASKLTRSAVIVLLLVSALLVAVITLGAWDALVGARAVQIAFVALYVLFAVLIARWSRGALPVAAALAVILAVFAAVSVPGWYDRDQAGFTDPALAAGVVGLITALLVPLQVLLIAFAMRGFGQAWNVEVERPA